MGSGQSCVGNGGRPGRINSLYGTCEVEWQYRTECEKGNTCHVKRDDGTTNLITSSSVPIINGHVSSVDSNAVCLIAMSFFAGVMLTSAVLAVGLLVRQRQRGRAVYLPVEEKGDF